MIKTLRRLYVFLSGSKTLNRLYFEKLLQKNCHYIKGAVSVGEGELAEHLLLK